MTFVQSIKRLADETPRGPGHAALRRVLLTARSLSTRRYKRWLRRMLEGRLAAPAALAGKVALYAALRPDSDVVFGAHPELKQLARKWVAHNVERNAGDLPRFYALAFNVKQVMDEAVPGHLAELGVYRGNSAAILAHYGRTHGRTTYLFDTFEGFDARDLKGVDGRKQAEFAETSLGLVRALVGDDGVRFVPGYFPDSVTAEVERQIFCLVHLDCDLYEPMKAGLEFFYPRLAPGGMLILHDYSSLYWEGAKRAIDQFVATIPERLVLCPDKSGTAMLRKVV